MCIGRRGLLRETRVYPSQNHVISQSPASTIPPAALPSPPIGVLSGMKPMEGPVPMSYGLCTCCVALVYIYNVREIRIGTTYRRPSSSRQAGAVRSPRKTPPRCARRSHHLHNHRRALRISPHFHCHRPLHRRPTPPSFFFPASAAGGRCREGENWGPREYFSVPESTYDEHSYSRCTCATRWPRGRPHRCSSSARPGHRCHSRIASRCFRINRCTPYPRPPLNSPCFFFRPGFRTAAPTVASIAVAGPTALLCVAYLAGASLLFSPVSDRCGSVDDGDGVVDHDRQLAVTAHPDITQPTRNFKPGFLARRPTYQPSSRWLLG